MQRDLLSFALDWYEPLRAIRSLGSQAPSVAHQGELAAARRQHLGQFFTPDAIAAFMWSFVSGWHIDRRIRLLDNSVGSGRLQYFPASPMRKRDLLKALSDPDLAVSHQRPPDRAVFFQDKEIEQCSSILVRLVQRSLSQESHGNRDALALPDVDLPMIF
jgi:hypothetical protein